MIIIHGAKNITGNSVELNIPNQRNEEIDGNGLTIFPGLIDPHVHFRVPGMEYKEDWKTAANAAIHGGYTTVFDMPNTKPPTITASLLAEKKAIIDAQLNEVGIPLRYQLFFGADKHHLNEIYNVQHDIIGIKVFMGCSTGNLVIDDDESLDKVFAIAGELNLLVAVHAEDEACMNANKAKFSHATYSDHSKIRSREAAIIAVKKAIALSKKYNTRLYILHVSTKEEVELIRAAKSEKIPVYAEVTPHHLFLAEKDYSHLQGHAVINPPLRLSSDNEALWKAIEDGTIDTVGSDHAPHTIAEKAEPYGACPSGMPGIETTLPLLLTAYHQKRITLEKIIALTYSNARQIFRLPENNDTVLVDLQKEKIVTTQDLKTKCGWSAFAGMKLKGWPVYTILQEQCFKL